MLSRVAESLYWLNRYMERADNVCRFLEVNHFLSMDLPRSIGSQWEPLVSVTGDRDLFIELHGDSFHREHVVEFLGCDVRNPNSILSCIRAARENARVVRDQLPDEAWESINQAWLLANDVYWQSQLRSNLYKALLSLRSWFKEYLGIVETTMTRDEAWYFSLLGMTLERGEKTSRTLDVKYFILLPSLQDVGTNIDNLQWEALLRSAGALHMYRRKHQTLAPTSIIQFLVLDREFPRSIHFCLEKADKALHEITGSPMGKYSTDVERYLGKVLAEAQFTSPKEILNQGLHEFLNDMQTKLNLIGDCVASTFFLASAPVQTAQTVDA